MPINANARMAVALNGSVVSTRRQLDLIEGTGIDMTLTDDATNERAQLTVAATGSGGGGGGGGSGAWTQIAQTVIASSGTTSVTFSGIPSTYNALELYLWARSDYTGTFFSELYWRANGDTASHYSSQAAQWNATVSTISARFAQTSAWIGHVTAGTAPAAYPAVGRFTIPGYASTSFTKTGLSSFMLPGGTSTNYYLEQFGVTWNQTAAMTSLTLLLSSGTFVPGSTLTLYGVT